MKAIARITPPTINRFSRSLTGTAKHIPAFCVSLLTLAATHTALADPWLDRVEKKLRHLQSSSEHIERAEIGSSVAAKHHKDCVRAAVESSCDRIIWRDPELGDIRDWAVGVAHIKRAEIREERGDVVGAIQDYQDSLKYHRYPLVADRIEKLTIMLAKVEADNRAATSAAVKAAPQRPPIPAGQQSKRRSAHPVVVLDGWSASLAALQRESETDKYNQNQLPLVTKHFPNNMVQPGAPIADHEASDSTPLISSQQAFSKALQTLTPGRKDAAMEVVFKSQQSLATSAATSSSEVSQSPATTDGVESTVITGSLPMAVPLATRQPPGLGVYGASAALLLAFVSLAAWRMQRPIVLTDGGIANTRKIQPQKRKQILSRHDIETMVKRRNSSAPVRVHEVPSRAPIAGAASPEPSSVITKPKEAADPSSSDCAHDKSTGSQKQKAAAQNAVPVKGAKAGTVDETITEDQPSPVPEQELPAIAVSAIKRVPHGAASVIALEGQSNITRQLFDAVPESKRNELRARHVALNPSGVELHGLLNIFAATRPLSLTDWQRRQAENSIIEVQGVCLSAIFGQSFMSTNRVPLRHVLHLMQQIPDAGFAAFLELLRARSLKQFYEPLSRLDHVAARMFFATEFLSGDFSRQRLYMAAKVEQLLEATGLQHLLNPHLSSDQILDALNDGAFIGLNSESVTNDEDQKRFLDLALLARLAMLNVFEKAQSAKQVAKAVIVDKSSAAFGQGQAEAKFLLDEVSKSGFTVVTVNADQFLSSDS